MDLTYVDPKGIKSLDDYMVAIVIGLLTLKTLREYHSKAMKQGILKDELNDIGNAIIWDFTRLLKLYSKQIELVQELLPPQMDMGSILLKLQDEEVKKARKLVKESKKG